ncbi:hypothetical protein YTPLAS73_08850 [Nitrosarchaeum sp.]|nr:hypothetical protein YTPLAS73_08850 [Nitrosarchaeum sp.]
MKKILPIIVASLLLGVYLILSLTVFPSLYLSKEIPVPQPFFEVKISNSSISLRESFDVDIFSKNIGDYGDIHILSVGFPSIDKITDEVKVINSDFNHQYRLIEKNTLIGSKYSAGVQKVESQYALIEIMNSPSPPNGNYDFRLSVTPKNTGLFEIYVKVIEIPHTSELSHLPRQGLLDPQGEYVAVYSAMVNP